MDYFLFNGIIPKFCKHSELKKKQGKRNIENRKETKDKSNQDSSKKTEILCGPLCDLQEGTI